ncbi:MAG: segregation/condensation protein A [Planctomycetota bacterium]|nr:segregation/condensation protein A [Planctomycetota bacterium]
MATTEDYAVRLEGFEGPLDLLLHLIRRAEVDVSEVSLASITDQYLRFLEKLSRIDVDPAGEFLVTAATLVELKSRVLVPPEDDEEPGEAGALVARDAGDPAAELVRALLEYKRFREASEKLEARRQAWLQRRPLGALGSPAAPPVPEGYEPPLDLEDLSLFDLAQAYARIASTVVFERLGQHAVVDDDTPIELHAADILERLRERSAAGSAGADNASGMMPLRALFSGKKRVEVIGMFLAVLELVRQRAVRVAQRGADQDVTIALTEGEEPAPSAMKPPEGSAG